MKVVAIRWYLRQWGRRLHWPGLTGLALVAASAALYAGFIQPMKAQIAELQREAVSIREFSRAAPDPSAAKARSQSDWLEQFYGLLPPKASAPEWLRIIFGAARAHSLGLQQGDYKVAVDKAGRLVAYEIALPVRGSYLQVRRFIAEVLEQIPAIALDEVTIRREAITDPRIEATIRLTLYMNAV